MLTVKACMNIPSLEFLKVLKDAKKTIRNHNQKCYSARRTLFFEQTLIERIDLKEPPSTILDMLDFTCKLKLNGFWGR